MGGAYSVHGEVRNAYKILIGKPKGKRPFGRPRHRWEDNIKMDLREIRLEGVDWIDLVQELVYVMIKLLLSLLTNRPDNLNSQKVCFKLSR
jgi:hypothetical protein